MQQEIFHPLGIYDMYIGNNLQDEKLEREGEYVGNGFTTLDLYGSGTMVPWEYGGFSIEAMDGHGGWIATSRDLVRLLVAVDGFATKPDILSSGTITSMTTPSANAPFYAKGWSVNSANNWWHTGAVDGTASIFVRSNNGYTWAIILNKRVVDGTANQFWIDLDGLGWNCISATATFPAHDLMDSPTLAASNLTHSGDGTSTMDVSWTNGNGSSRVVVAKDITNSTDTYHFSAYPIDGEDYVANAEFGSGDDLGDGSFVVYDGSGSNVTITGLDPSKVYALRVYEYTKNSNNGNNALYLLGNAPEREATLSVTEANLSAFITLYPTITSEKVNVEVLLHTEVAYTLNDVHGRTLIQNILVQGENTIPVQSLQSGLYLITFTVEGKKMTSRIIVK